MSLTKLSIGGNNLYMKSLFPPRESLVSDIPAGDGNIEKLFYTVHWLAFEDDFIEASQEKLLVTVIFFNNKTDR
jgi:hypothetical protein